MTFILNNKKLKTVGIQLICFFFFCQLSYSQNAVRWQWPFTEPSIGLETSYFIGSPTLQDDFIKAYFDGDFLNESLKEKTISNLEAENIFGAHNNFKITFVLPLPKSSFVNNFFGSLSNKSVLDLSFEKPLFELVFLGNEPFTGEELFFSGNSFYFTNFSQIKGGLTYSLNTAERMHNFAVAAALNTGTRHNYFEIHEGGFFTATDATYLDIKLKAEMQWVNNESDDLLKIFNGFGGGLDFYYGYVCTRGNRFHLSVKDVGYVYWSKPHAIVLDVDTSIYYDGILIEDILDIRGSTERFNKDTLTEEFGKLTSNEGFWHVLPGALQAYYSYAINHRLNLGLGLQHYINLSAKPVYYFDMGYKAFPWLTVLPGISYGGYSNLAAGLNAEINYKDYYCYVGSDFLTSFVNSNMFSGRGIYLRIIKKINTHEKSSFNPERPIIQ